MHAIAFAFGCTCIGATIFQCMPVNAMWDISLNGHCIDMNAFNYFNSGFMLATDLVLYAMPTIFTWNLHLRRPQKVGVNVLFALGLLVLAASAARIYSVHAQAENPDFTYIFAATMICAVIENHLAIIVACAPSIKVILLLKFPTLADKFEKLVSKPSQEESSFRSRRITFDLENRLGAKEESKEAIRPVASRAATEESRWSRESRMGKWWRAPSNWDVNAVGSVRLI